MRALPFLFVAACAVILAGQSGALTFQDRPIEPSPAAVPLRIDTPATAATPPPAEDAKLLERLLPHIRQAAREQVLAELNQKLQKAAGVSLSHTQICGHFTRDEIPEDLKVLLRRVKEFSEMSPLR